MTVVITGGSDGIGLEAPSQLARTEPDAGSCCRARTPGVAAAAVGRVRADRRRARVDSLLCDFAEQAAVRRLAEHLLASYPRIDVLVNNAGTVFARRTVTADGIEATFAVNHLAGFLLTELLLDRLVASAPARIVTTSSAGHYGGTMDLDDLGFERGYQIMRAYSRSKLANVLYTRDLAARLEGTGVTANCLHPGAVATNIWSGAPWFARPVARGRQAAVHGQPGNGRRTRIAYLATSPDVEGATGGYYEQDKLKEPAGLGTRPRGRSTAGGSEPTARRPGDLNDRSLTRRAAAPSARRVR